ncbi:MAG: ribulose-phosphate 3-epimerase [Alphaproteobacteria bacterium]|nr:ribulose-phosphate 3-epimerase [Alphaproteobacteria bacterium]
MNLIDHSFLCLDIGAGTVRGMGTRIVSGKIAKSRIQSFESTDTAAAIKSVVDIIEQDIGARFDSAFITGNFGEMEFNVFTRIKDWGKEHKITASDISAIVKEIPELGEGFDPLHIIPLRYDLCELQNITTPIGIADSRIAAAFASIAYKQEALNKTREVARVSHIMARDFFDPAFLIANTMRPKKEAAVLLDLGATQTTVSVWTARGPVFMKKLDIGQSMITDAISNGLGIKRHEAELVKRESMDSVGRDMDRFTPAHPKYDFTKFDINEYALPILTDIVNSANDAARAYADKYSAGKVYLYGGGANIRGINEFVSNIFGIPVKNLGESAALQSMGLLIWKQIEPLARAYDARAAARRKIVSFFFNIISKLKPKKRRCRYIPIMPSTQAFNMRDPATYARFKSGGIQMIHVDIMDGFYVDKIVGGIDELKFIREHTNAHLNVHLMTENPLSWVDAACDAGANTIIISTGTSGVKKAIAEIKCRGLRAGVALHPESPIEILKPILRDIDEVLVMAIFPGPIGQAFIPDALARVSALANTRKRYNLNFKISVDGGINADTAKQCWKAGADFLTSGSYLARAPDFAIAVQSLLPQ